MAGLEAMLRSLATHGHVALVSHSDPRGVGGSSAEN